MWMLAGVAYAAVQVPVQGAVTDVNGTPLHGSFTVTFQLYNDAAGGPGHLIWDEPAVVQFQHGAFAANLGATDALLPSRPDTARATPRTARSPSPWPSPTPRA